VNLKNAIEPSTLIEKLKALEALIARLEHCIDRHEREVEESRLGGS
jgi:hypothetical protein